MQIAAAGRSRLGGCARRRCGRGGGIRRQSERPGLRHSVRNASVPSSAVGVSVLDLADPPELIALFVEPELIGSGIGPVLLGKLIDRARAAGAEHCWSRGTPTRSRLPPWHGAPMATRRMSSSTGRDLPQLLSLPVTAVEQAMPPADDSSISRGVSSGTATRPCSPSGGRTTMPGRSSTTRRDLVRASVALAPTLPRPSLEPCRLPSCARSP